MRILKRLSTLLLLAASLPASSSAAQAQRKGVRPAAVRPAAGNARADALVAEGAAALSRGDEQAARDAFTRALQADPEHVDAHTYLGVLADRAGDLKEAEKHFATAAAFAPFNASVRNNYG